MLKLKVQTLFYENDPGAIQRSLDSLLGLRQPEGYEFQLNIGDCSAQPLLSEEQTAGWQRRFEERGWTAFNFRFFEQNLGFGKGHNQLYHETGPTDRLLLVNPDGVVPFHLVERLDRFSQTRSDWGILEPRQIPFEHPKDFDKVTLETSFASGACAFIDAALFEACGGFDETFFMYVEDVDLSWRIRALGRKVYFALDTFFYHSKHVDSSGIVLSESEKYYGRLSWLILRAKYGRSDLVKSFVKDLQTNRTENNNAALLAEWSRLKGQIVPATPAQQAAATFSEDGASTPRRWSYV